MSPRHDASDSYPDGERPGARRPLLTWLRWLGTIALVVYIFSNAKPGRIAEQLWQADFQLVALAILLYAVDRCLAALKWRVIYASHGRPLGFGRALSAYLRASFLGAALPATVGTDLIRARLVSGRGGEGFGYALGSVVIERAAGLVALGWAALVGILIFTPDALREPLRPLLTVGLVLLIGISFIFFWAPDPHGLRRFANARGLRPLVRFLEQAHAYSRNRRVLVSSLGLALAQHYLLTTISWILALALGLDISLTVLLWVWPLVMVAVRVPLSILGFGIREFVLFEIASLGGFTGAAGVSLGLLSGALELLFIGFGGILVLQRIGRASSPSQSSRSHLMSHPPTYAP